jgi:hypothetical protein
MAHDSLAMVSRLCLNSLGRKPSRSSTGICCPAHHVCAHVTVARGHSVIPTVGWSVVDGPDLRTPVTALHVNGMDTPSPPHHVHLYCRVVGALPGDECSRYLEYVASDVQPTGSQRVS